MFIKHISITVETDKETLKIGGTVKDKLTFIQGVDVVVELWRRIWR